jgi:hypothetical protein
MWGQGGAGLLKGHPFPARDPLRAQDSMLLHQLQHQPPELHLHLTHRHVCFMKTPLWFIYWGHDSTVFWQTSLNPAPNGSPPRLA